MPVQILPWNQIDTERALRFSAEGFNGQPESGPNLKEQLRSIDLGYSLGALVNGNLLAVTQCSIFDQHTEDGVRKVLANTGTAVHPDHRGRGLGQSLLRTLTTLLREGPVGTAYAWGKNSGLTGADWTQSRELTFRQLIMAETQRSEAYAVQESLSIEEFCRVQSMIASSCSGSLALHPEYYAALCCGPDSRIVNFVVQSDGKVIGCAWGSATKNRASFTASDVFTVEGHGAADVLSAIARRAGYSKVNVLDSGNWGDLEDISGSRDFVGYLYAFHRQASAEVVAPPMRTPFYF